MPHRVPSRDEITDDTPLQLDAAAVLGGPGGSMTAAALRRKIHKGRLPAEFLAGKHWVTLAGIREFRELCRVRVEEPVSIPPLRTTASSAFKSAHVAAGLVALGRSVQALKKRRTGPTGRNGA